MAFEYKCVAGPTIVAVKNAKARDQAVKAFEDIMNAEAGQGWEYVGIDEFHISEPVGILSRKRIFVPSKILVFKRAKAPSAVFEALRVQSANGDTTGLVEMKEHAPLLVPPPNEVLQDGDGQVSRSDVSLTSIKSIADQIKRPKA